MSNSDNLTKEQLAILPTYIEKYIKVGLDTSRCNRAEAESAISDSYAYRNLPRPKKFFWFDGLFDALQFAARVAMPECTDVNNIPPRAPTKQEIQEIASRTQYGSFEAYWVSFYDFVVTEVEKKPDALKDLCVRIVENTGCYWTFEDCVVICERPSEIHLKDDKLHNDSGPAIKWPDGSGIFVRDNKFFRTELEMQLAAKFGDKEE